ncbi:TIGR03668 family PPOX class F420-dependent oxidoreductase [Streptomyces sp. NPDC048639]|uniref:TIGR03668 family PPOX class F420-dependent oxidoreductase n=1 Tax=Streptomyces sp. NPDC048639 TaxID=3365581 RepID=UPI00371612F4
MELEPAEARRRFAAAPVARLATVSGDGRPHLVPVTFALDGDTLFSAVDHKPKRTQDLRRLRNIRADVRVALLADHYAEDWAALWWARADGTAEIVEDEAGRARPVALLREKYAQYRERPPRGPVVAITVERWSGWSYAS